MALTSAASRCAICDEKLDRPYTATSGVVFPREHLLWRYCDAPLHFDCLETWPHRVEFSLGYFNWWVQNYESGYGHLLRKENDWILVTGPDMSNGMSYFAAVHLREWPFRLYSKWTEWDRFVSSGFPDNLIEDSLQVAEQVMEEVVKIAPDLDSLMYLLEKERG
ncbi:MAG: hypothetical protein KJ069_18760 [Anaerolineae bacterium]|nr:hypothetical protein [Anaerolineae bacterium]